MARLVRLVLGTLLATAAAGIPALPAQAQAHAFAAPAAGHASAAPAAGHASAAPAAGALPPAPRVPGAPTSPYVVLAAPGRTASAAEAVRLAGGHVRRALPLVDGWAVDLPAAAVAGLGRAAGVLSVSPDTPMQVTGSSYPTSNNGDSYPTSTGAVSVWAGGHAGEGTAVAVVDTGVAPVPDLAGRLVKGPDLSGEGDATLDSYGHGTVMAGLVAGSGGKYTGMAPRAQVVSVKVAGRSGATDVSTVLAALQWVGSFHTQLGISVVNLSWGTRSRQSALVDPLDLAVERLWQAGVVVVVAAGNNGPYPGTVTKPGDDPVVLTAGAYDEVKPGPADDTVPAWSGRGPTVDGVSKPDLVAPGRTLVSTVAPGSVVAQQNPSALVGSGYIRGSGTSQATAVTSGAVALLLSARPDLRPDQVKAALRATAAPLAATPTLEQGAGRLALAPALSVPADDRTQALPATGLGSLELSRGGQHVLTTCAGDSSPTLIAGEMDAQCHPFSSESWSSESWSSESWSSESWSSESWSSESWSSESWSSESWSSESWSAPPSDGFATAFWGVAAPRGRHLAGEPTSAPALADPE